MRQSQQFKKRQATVSSRATCYDALAVGFGEAGVEIYLLAPDIESLRRAWSRVTFKAMDETQVQSVTIFGQKVVQNCSAKETGVTDANA